MSSDGDLSACEVAFKKAMEKTIEVCNSPEEAMQQAGPVLGINPEPDEGCEAALEEGLDEETCTDFRGLRQWVMCRVFHSPDGEEALLEDHDGNFQAAISEAWDEAKDACEPHDVTV